MNEAAIPNETAIKKIVQYLAREATKYQDMIGLDAAHDIDISGLQSAIEDSNNKKILNFWNKLSSKQKNEIHNMVSTYLYNNALKADPDYYGSDQPTPVNYKLSSKTATPTKAPAGDNESKLIKSLAKKAEDWMNYVDIDSPENISYDDFEEFVINDPKNKKLQAFWNSMGNKKQEDLFYKVVDVLEKKYGDGDDMYEGRNLSNIAKKMIKENKSTPLMLNGKEVDEKSIEIDGVDRRDYPDFSDAYISAANYIDGTPLSDKEIEDLDAQNNELVHEKIQDDQLYMQEGEASKQEEPSSQQQKNRFEWENDPYHSRRFEKSDVSWREYDMDMNPQNYRVKEGEEEKLGSSAYDREDREEKAARGKKATCRVCHKPFTPSYGEHSRCPSCMSKQHSSGEKATGTQ